jgi:carnitine-CoA ligase
VSYRKGDAVSDSGAWARDLTVLDLLRRAVSLWGDRPYLHFEEQVYTFRDLEVERSRVTHALQALGLSRGARVGALLPNRPEFLSVWFGAMGHANPLVPINPNLTPREIEEIVRLSGCAIIVVVDETMALATEALTDLQDQVAIVPLQELLQHSPDRGADADLDPDDPVVFLATSGTTGAPKLVVQTHRSYAMTGESFPAWLGLDSNDRMMALLPLFHLNAQAYSTLGSLWAGARLILAPRFSARNFWAETRSHGVTQFNSIGAILEILVRQDARPDDAENPVRMCYTAPAPATAEQHRAIEHRFGMEIMVGYALSESPFGTIWPLRGPRPYASIGRPRQHPRLGHVNDYRIVDELDVDVEPEADGELLLRNPAVMKCYFGNPSETEATIVEGWLHTGDLVREESNGDLFFVARKKEVIRRRGENLSPAEVENVLVLHPAVNGCAVVAVPSDLGEDEVKVFVVSDPPLDRTLIEKIVSWCEERLAKHKIPRYWESITQLPYTPTGRIAKFMLPRDRTAGEIDVEYVSDYARPTGRTTT